MTDTPKKLIVDIAKGTHEYVDLTPAEIAERDQMAAQAAVDRAAREAEEAAKAATSATAPQKTKHRS